MKNLPKEFTELNKLVHEFNSDPMKLFLLGKGRYLLLQGNRRNGYKLYLMEGEKGTGKVCQLLVNGGNKKRINDAFDLINNLVSPAIMNALGQRCY